MKNYGREAFYNIDDVGKKTDLEISISNVGYYSSSYSPYIFNMDSDVYMLLYMYEGNATIKIYNKRVELNAGMIGIFPPNTKYDICYHNDKNNERYYLFCKGKRMAEIINALELNALIYDVGIFNEFIEAIKTFITEMQKKTKRNRAYEAVILCNILAKIHEKIEEKNISKQYLCIEPAIKYMTSHYKEGSLTTEQYAEMCGVSKVSFIKYFKRYKKTTPLKFLTKIKMENAQMQLLNSNKNIQEIAFDLGFTDPFYFSRVFRSFVGKSPREFRETTKF